MSDDPLAGLDPPVVVEPAGPATASVVWLHGLGADGHDFEPVVPELARDELRDVRYVFPHAPRIPVTINGGMEMRAWYDVVSEDLARRADAAGVARSARVLAALVAAERARGIDARRIVVAGFSQGGAIALHAGLRHPEPLAGILALSTYLPAPETVAREASEASRAVPVFMAHGSQDPLIPLSLSESSRAFLSGLGYVIETHTYPMPHSVCAEEIRDIADWLARVLARR